MGDGDYVDAGEIATAGEYEFTLDGSTTLPTDASGQVIFENVTPDGDHTITEQQIIFTAGTYDFDTGSGTNCTFVSSTATANVAAGTSNNVQDASCDFFNVLSAFPPSIEGQVVKTNDATLGDGSTFTEIGTVPDGATYPYTVTYQLEFTNLGDPGVIDDIADDTHDGELQSTLLCTHPLGVRRGHLRMD